MIAGISYVLLPRWPGAHASLQILRYKPGRPRRCVATLCGLVLLSQVLPLDALELTEHENVMQTLFQPLAGALLMGHAPLCDRFQHALLCDRFRTARH